MYAITFTRRIVFFALFLAFVFRSHAQDVANEKAPVGIDFFTKVQRIANLKEHKGEIFFILSGIDLDDNRYTPSDLYQLVNGTPVRLARDVSDYAFEDGGIIFRSVREEKDRERIKKGEKLTVYQKLSQGYGEAQEWLRLPFEATHIEWIDREHFFYTSPYDHTFARLLREAGGDFKEANKKKEEDQVYRVFDELPFWSNGRGDVSGSRTHLYYYADGESKLLTDTLASASQPELSPDKRTLAYTRRAAYYGKAPEGNSLVTLDVATLEQREWSLFDRATYGNVQFISNDEIVLTISRGLEHDRIENAGFYRLNIRTGVLTEIYDGSIYGFGNSIGTDVGGGGRSKITFDTKGIRYVTTSVDHAPLIHVSYKDAAVTFLTKDRLTVQEYIPYHDGYLVVGLLDQYGSEIYQVDKSGKPRALTAINKSLFDGHRITVPQEIIWTNGEGRKLNGWVLPPANYKKGESYPAILSIHGGPKTAYGTVFFHEMQYWANQGYAVFYTNPRGSDGRGSEFADIRGRFGEVDYEDLMLFTDAVLLQVDFIDSTRLGVTGGSYGGVMTNWIVGHTDRFKAAAALRSISSWLTFGTTSDIGHTFTYNYWGTDLWRNGKKLWEGSPLKYADRVKTPTLFLHSEEDYRCWLVEGIQMYYALQYFGVPTRLVVFTDENHDLSRNGKPLNRIRRLEELTLWFKTYLNP